MVGPRSDERGELLLSSCLLSNESPQLQETPALHCTPCSKKGRQTQLQSLSHLLQDFLSFLLLGWDCALGDRPVGHVHWPGLDIEQGKILWSEWFIPPEKTIQRDQVRYRKSHILALPSRWRARLTTTTHHRAPGRNRATGCHVRDHYILKCHKQHGSARIFSSLFSWCTGLEDAIGCLVLVHEILFFLHLHAQGLLCHQAKEKMVSRINMINRPLLLSITVDNISWHRGVHHKGIHA